MKLNLSKNIKWFVVVIVVAIVLWQSIFNVVCAPTKQESISLFITSATYHKQKIENKLKDLDVQKINVVAHSQKADYYDEYFATVGLLNSDLLVIENSVFEMEYAYQEFAPLTAELLAKYGIDATKYTFVTANNENYAIVLHDKSKNISLLKDLFTPSDEDKVYCLVVNVNMPNAKPYSKGDWTTDNAFVALAKLLK